MSMIIYQVNPVRCILYFHKRIDLIVKPSNGNIEIQNKPCIDYPLGRKAGE